MQKTDLSITKNIYDFILTINPEQDTFSIVSSISKIVNELAKEKYSDAIEVLINKLLKSPQKEYVLLNASTEIMKENLITKDIHSFSVLYTDSKKQTFIKEIHYLYQDKSKKKILVLCVDKTIESTKIFDLQKEVEQALVRVEQATMVKTEFLSRMSHDIRTPINGILGMTDIALQNIEDTDKILHCLDRIKLASNHLLTIVSDMLDVSRIENGSLKLEEEAFLLKDIVSDISTTVALKAREKGLIYAFSFQDGLDRAFLGDVYRLKQVFFNLLDNAVKNTMSGGHINFDISFNVLSEADIQKNPVYEDHECIIFTVSDTGVGMTKELQKKIFSMFEQSSDNQKREFGGVGLGLAIVKSLVDMMQGSIDLDSSPGNGSVFTLKIPLKTYNLQEAKIEKAKKEEKSLSANSIKFCGQRVLLVEDNEMNMEIAKDILLKANLKIDMAWNGRESFDKFQKSAVGYYKLIIMDIRMPEMDGREATQLIRKLDRSDASTIPIVALSADAFVEEVKSSQAVGMNDYVTKPIEKEVFLITLAKYLSSSSVN